MHGAKNIKNLFIYVNKSSLADNHQSSHSHYTYVTISYFTSTVSFYFCSLLKSYKVKFASYKFGVSIFNKYCLNVIWWQCALLQDSVAWKLIHNTPTFMYSVITVLLLGNCA